MSKNDEKSNNPFAKLAAMQFPDKNAPEKARRVSVPAESINRPMFLLMTMSVCS